MQIVLLKRKKDFNSLLTQDQIILDFSLYLIQWSFKKIRNLNMSAIQLSPWSQLFNAFFFSNLRSDQILSITILNNPLPFVRHALIRHFLTHMSRVRTWTKYMLVRDPLSLEAAVGGGGHFRCLGRVPAAARGQAGTLCLLPWRQPQDAVSSEHLSWCSVFPLLPREREIF